MQHMEFLCAQICLWDKSGDRNRDAIKYHKTQNNVVGFVIIRHSETRIVSLAYYYLTNHLNRKRETVENLLHILSLFSLI